MTIPIGTKGQPDFTQPIALMMDCHRRIEHFWQVLGRVIDQYRDRPLDDEGREALATALNYFQSGAPRHTEDEELSLFPRLRQSNDPAMRAALTDIQRLEADHEQAVAGHARLDQIGRQWLAAGRIDPTTHTELATLIAEMTAVYAAHIRLEDEKVFMIAEHLLSADVLSEIGREMAQRRVENPGRPGSRCAERRKQRLARA